MKIHYLAVIPAAALMIACGGSSTPEPATPATAAAEEKAETPAQEKAEEKSETPAAEKAEKPADAAPAAEKK